MNVKTKDKIATGVFYAIAVLIVIILAGLLGYILVKGKKKTGGITHDCNNFTKY